MAILLYQEPITLTVLVVLIICLFSFEYKRKNNHLFSGGELLPIIQKRGEVEYVRRLRRT